MCRKKRNERFCQSRQARKKEGKERPRPCHAYANGKLTKSPTTVHPWRIRRCVNILLFLNGTLLAFRHALSFVLLPPSLTPTHYLLFANDTQHKICSDRVQKRKKTRWLTIRGSCCPPPFNSLTPRNLGCAVYARRDLVLLLSPSLRLLSARLTEAQFHATFFRSLEACKRCLRPITEKQPHVNHHRRLSGTGAKK